MELTGSMMYELGEQVFRVIERESKFGDIPFGVDGLILGDENYYPNLAEKLFHFVQSFDSSEKAIVALQPVLIRIECAACARVMRD